MEPTAGDLHRSVAEEPSATHGDAGAAPRGSSRTRRILIRVLVWATTLLALVGIIAIWANRQMLAPDNWANTSTELLQKPVVRTAVANYLVDQLYANVNVREALANQLGPALQPLAGPVSGALRGVAVTTAERLLANPHIVGVWRVANRVGDQALVDIVNGKQGTVAVDSGQVTIDLAAVVRTLAQQLGLPDLSSKLPATIGKLTVLKSGQIKTVQDAGKALRGLALTLTILVPLLYSLAIFLARGRRRETLMTVGLSIALAGVLVFVARKVAISAVTNSLLKNDANEPAAKAVLSIATSELSEIAGAFVVIGVPLMLAAWFAGPARWAKAGRQRLAPVMREHAAWAFGAVAVALLLIFLWGPIPATHRPAGIVVFSCLAMGGTEVLRRQLARESARVDPAHA